MAKQIMLRRTFWSIHRGHLREHDADEDPEVELVAYWNHLISLDWKSLGFTGVAISLERGSETERTHVQGYAEHSQMRLTTLAKKLGVSPTSFSVVRSSKDSYDYCTKSGVHHEKPGVLRLYEWGEFKLHGDTMKADLRMMVDLVLQGTPAGELLMAYPYAWTVHRDRLRKLYLDLDELERRGRLDITRPPRH